MFKRLFNITICLVMILGSLSIVGGDQTVMADVANLDDIAGISAYTQVTSGETFLSDALLACDGIPELSTADYFICSVSIDGYSAVYAPHVFVHEDGWIMAYYLKDEPAAKIIDVIAQPLVDPDDLDKLFPTLLEQAVFSVMSAVTIEDPIIEPTVEQTENPIISFYDFNNPDATDMLFVAEDKAEDLGELGDDDHWFTIALPDGTYNETTYAFYQNYYPLFAKDGADFVKANADYIGPVPSGTIYGTLGVEGFDIGESYLFEVDTFSLAKAGYGALLITFSGVDTEIDPFVIESADWVEEFTLVAPSTVLTDLFIFDFAPATFTKYTAVYDEEHSPTVATLSWQESLGATSYEYCIDETMGDTCEAGWVSIGTATSVTLTELPYNATYYWQVRAVNGYETTEADGGTWFYFATKTGPPDAFGKVSPTDELEMVATSPLLDWEETDGAEYYEYCITSGLTCEDWVNTGLVSQAIVNLQINSEYNWQVRAGNSDGQTYADDKTWSFKTVQTTFKKSSPEDGTPGVDPKATLIWEGMDGATSYQYCLNTKATCSKWITVSSDVNIKEITVKGLKYTTTYFWQVRAVTVTGTIEADDGTWWSFTTRDRKAPIKQTPVFDKKSPTDGAPNQEYANLLLDWGDVSKVTSYDYCIDMSDDDACSKWIKVYESQITIMELTPSETYYWQVRATVAGIVGYADGGYWSFTTKAEPVPEP